MSHLTASVCFDNNSGRPPSDAGVTNFKATSGSGASKIFACEVSTGGLVAGTAVIDNLSVNTLTVNGTDSNNPSFIILPGFAGTGSTGTATFNPATDTITLGTLGDSFTWVVNTPPSDSWKIRFYISSVTSTTVTVNGVSLGSVGPGAATVTTSSFEWVGGPLTVVITASANSTTIVGSPVIL